MPRKILTDEERINELLVRIQKYQQRARRLEMIFMDENRRAEVMTPSWAEKQARKIYKATRYMDAVKAHQESDQLMEDILIVLGYDEMVEFIRAQHRWYQ